MGRISVSLLPEAAFSESTLRVSMRSVSSPRVSKPSAATNHVPLVVSIGYGEVQILKYNIKHVI